MPKLPVVSGDDVVRALGHIGFSPVSQRGSHRKLIVPMHPEIAPGTLRSILRQAGIDGEEFIAALA